MLFGQIDKDCQGLITIQQPEIVIKFLKNEKFSRDFFHHQPIFSQIKISDSLNTTTRSQLECIPSSTTPELTFAAPPNQKIPSGTAIENDGIVIASGVQSIRTSLPLNDNIQCTDMVR